MSWVLSITYGWIWYTFYIMYWIKMGNKLINNYTKIQLRVFFLSLAKRNAYIYLYELIGVVFFCSIVAFIQVFRKSCEINNGLTIDEKPFGTPKIITRLGTTNHIEFSDKFLKRKSIALLVQCDKTWCYLCLMFFFSSLKFFYSVFVTVNLVIWQVYDYDGKFH